MQTFQERTIKPGTSITDFVKNDLLSASTTLGFCDNHFFPQISFLIPGIDYHIFKLEDGLTAVSEFIGLKFLGMVQQQTIGHLGKGAPVETQLEENINLSNEAIDILKDVYKKDFENFSYENVDFYDYIISIRKLSQYRSSLSDRAAADLAAFASDFVRSDTSIFRLSKRCRRSDGIAREK